VLTWAELYFLSEWAIRVAMLVYVPQRRSPAAARTWLLLVFIVPWPGLVLYSIFGRAYLPRRRLDDQRRVGEALRALGPNLTAADPPTNLPETFTPAIALARNLGGFGVVGGNAVELLEDYDGSIDRLLADIAAARSHVHLLYYIFAADRTGRRVADALVDAAKRGVTCRLLIDSLGAKTARRRLAPGLRAAGVEVIEVLPVHFFRRGQARFDLRNHRKIAVVDGRVAYVGSQNVVDADFKPGIVYEELVARVTGPVVRQLQAVFLADRFYETEEPLVGPEFFPDLPAAGTAAAQTLPSGPGFPQENNERLVVSLVHGARRRVCITTPYFVPDESLQNSLVTAARRGVEVRLIVARQVDQYMVGLAQRSYYEELLEAGVHIHEYGTRFLHAKHLTVDDDVAAVGSSNMDIRSFALNAEVLLLAYDAGVARDLRAVEDRYLAAAHEVHLDGWRRRPTWLKVAQNTARLVDSLL
jgi:cardiolipin synthase A/B